MLQLSNIFLHLCNMFHVILQTNKLQDIKNNADSIEIFQLKNDLLLFFAILHFNTKFVLLRRVPV